MKMMIVNLEKMIERGLKDGSIVDIENPNGTRFRVYCFSKETFERGEEGYKTTYDK